MSSRACSAIQIYLDHDVPKSAPWRATARNVAPKEHAMARHGAPKSAPWRTIARHGAPKERHGAQWRAQRAHLGAPWRAMTR
jgi:hypothetical protein